MTDEKHTALLPCPFCGGTSVRVSQAMSKSGVYCETCKTSGPSVWHGGPNAGRQTINRCDAEAIATWNLRSDQVGWRTMDSAPLDGKHCILAVKEGAFIYSVQGAHQSGAWNCVHRANVEPMYWMPNKLLPEGWEVLEPKP